MASKKPAPVDIPAGNWLVKMHNAASDTFVDEAPIANSESVESTESRDLSHFVLLNRSQVVEMGGDAAGEKELCGEDNSLQMRLDEYGHAPWQNLALVHGAIAPEHRAPQPHQRHTSIHWFRHGLRLHDNPALVEALRDAREVYFVFIFDGHVAGTDTAQWNRMSFLLESLRDLEQSLRMYNGKLFVYHGSCVDVLRQRFQDWNVTKLTFQQDPEAVWHDRDNAVRQLCAECNVECVECSSHTLWDPHRLLAINGGVNRPPPVKFKEFVALCDKAGEPERPISYPTELFEDVIFRNDNNAEQQHNSSTAVPDLPSFFGIEKELEDQRASYVGGEKAALALFDVRMNVEKAAIERGVTLPNQKYVNLLRPPLSLSPYLRFGCISVRKFYWAVHDEFKKTRGEEAKAPLTLTSQLLWREYFYLMSANNRNYAQVANNPVCYPIPWDTNHELFEKWKLGRTGYPWIDACMRQMRREGWVHQACRYSAASFLSRGDLWLNWEDGMRVFSAWLIDADWSLMAGNWMWISSSAFEKALDHPMAAHPVRYGKTQDPSGDYVRKWVPELRRMIPEYLFEPWMCPKSVQVKLGCIIGRDYPEPCVVHKDVYKRNKLRMKEFCRAVLLSRNSITEMPRCEPSDPNEVAIYTRLFGNERNTLMNGPNAEEMDGLATAPQQQNSQQEIGTSNALTHFRTGEAEHGASSSSSSAATNGSPPALPVTPHRANTMQIALAPEQQRLQQLYLVSTTNGGEELMIQALPIMQYSDPQSSITANVRPAEITALPDGLSSQPVAPGPTTFLQQSLQQLHQQQQQHPHFYHPYSRPQ